MKEWKSRRSKGDGQSIKPLVLDLDCFGFIFGFDSIRPNKKRSLPIVLDREGLILTRELFFDYPLIFIGVQMN